MTTAQGVLIELPDGSFAHKPFEALQPNDMVVFDGPYAFAEVAREQAAFEAKIAAAGGFEAWKAQELHHA